MKNMKKKLNISKSINNMASEKLDKLILYIKWSYF